MSLLSESQIVELAALVLEIVPVGETMMENFEEMLRGRVEDKTRAKYAPAPFMGTIVLPTSDQLKLVNFPELPYMPGVIRYVGCKAIKYAGGLMTPCGGKVKNCDFCVTCQKKATEKNGGVHEYGTLDDRADAYDDGNKYSFGGKTEISFGDYLAAKKKTREEAKQAIREAGFSFNIPEECFARSSAEKKRSGRPKKVEAAAESEEAEEVVEAPKPKVKKQPLTLEEKIAKMKADEEAKVIRAKAREEKKAETAQKKAEEAEKKAKAAAEKAAKKEAEPKKTKKTKADLANLLNSDNESEDEAEEIEDNDSVAGSLEVEVVEEEEYEAIRVKGVVLSKGKTSLKLYAEEDTAHKVCVGTFVTEKNSVDFHNNPAAKVLIEEQIQAEITKFKSGKLTKPQTKISIDGVAYIFDHNKQTFADTNGAIFWNYNAEKGTFSDN
jgi:hypothetical protein